MGLLSSKSSSTKFQTTSIDNSNTAAQDNATVIGKGARVDIELVDPGARNIIETTNAYLGQTFSDALGFANQSQLNTIEGITSVLNDKQTGGLGVFLPFMIVGAVGLGFYMWMKKS